MSTVLAGPQSSAYQALYRSCMKEAAAQGGVLMRQLVVRARKSMPQQAAQMSGALERNLLTESARILMKHENALCEAYPQALLAEFAQAIAGDTRGAGVLSFDALESVGDEQVRESVELVRTQQAVLLAVGAELAELNALMCAVQGLDNPKALRNPLRPDIYVSSLRTVTLQSPVPAAVRARWMQHLGTAMGPELARVYRELSAMLRREGVSEAGAGGAVSATAPAGQVAMPAASALPTLLHALASEQSQARVVLDVTQLRRLLSGEFDPQGQHAAGSAAPAAVTAFSATVPASFETLQEMKQVDRALARVRERRSAGLTGTATGSAVLRAEMQKEARGAGQALSLEVVALMVDNISDDSRLLPPIQKLVRHLEPALLRLALTDPRFFSDKKHPARQLLEQLTQRSLAWQADDTAGFAAFLEPLQQVVDALLKTRVAGAGPFEFALKALQQTWGDQQQHAGRLRERAVRALSQAEQRNLLAAKISSDMRGRAEIAGAPHELARFVTGPWSQVMAQASLSDQAGSVDPGGYGNFVIDLISSVQLRLGPGNATRLARLVPPLLEKLRSGLASIDYPPAQTVHFFDYLESLHRQALKPATEADRREASTGRLTRAQLDAQFDAHDGNGHGDSDSDSDSDGEGDESNRAWLAPAEARHSGFIDDPSPAVSRPGPQRPLAGAGGGHSPANVAGLAPALPPAILLPGAWIELFLESRWSRYQLTWASPHGTLFMFIDGATNTHSMTRRLLDKMLLAGSLRLVSGQAVVDGALDAVAQTALRNSAGPAA